MWLDPITRRSLVQWPVTELESLRAYNVRKDNVVLERESVMKVEGLNSGAAQVIQIRIYVLIMIR